MANKQEYGLVLTPDTNYVNNARASFKDFTQWAMVGDDESIKSRSGVFISRKNLQEMLDVNVESDGFHIFAGITEEFNEESPKRETLRRNLEIMIAAITFDNNDNNDWTHRVDRYYTEYQTSPEPPVLRSPPLGDE